jgi:hypothetical protein
MTAFEDKRHECILQKKWMSRNGFGLISPLKLTSEGKKERKRGLNKKSVSACVLGWVCVCECVSVRNIQNGFQYFLIFLIQLVIKKGKGERERLKEQVRERE